MITKVHSTLLSGLVLVALVWGHCTACPLAFAVAGTTPQQDDHSCCPPRHSSDPCDQPSEKGDQDCPRMAAGVQDYTYKADSGIAAPVLAALPAVAAEGVPAPCARVDAARVAPAHSPTDVFLKNAALLI